MRSYDNTPDKEFFKSLNPQQQSAYKEYKSFSEPIQLINRKLNDTKELDAKEQDFANAFDSMFELHKSKEELYLFRGTNVQYVKHLSSAGTLQYLSYISTSVRSQSIGNFIRAGETEDVIIVNCPIGTPMVLMQGSSSNEDNEYEVVLQRGTIFKIDNVSRIDDINEICNTYFSSKSPEYLKFNGILSLNIYKCSIQ